MCKPKDICLSVTISLLVLSSILGCTYSHIASNNSIALFKNNENEKLAYELEEQIELETERLDKRYETMAQQFVQLDSYMRRMESQQNYVSQIFSATDQNKE